MAAKRKVTSVTFPDTGLKKFNKGDRVWYKAETWYVHADTGGDFVKIRDDPDEFHEKCRHQSVPRVTLRKNEVIPSGNGTDLSEAEQSYKEKYDDRRKIAKQQRAEMDQAADSYWKKGGRKKRGEKHVREVKPKDPNLVPLKKICKDANVDPKIARRLLRAEKSIPRPEGRWEFDPKDVERIRKVITQLV